MHVGLVYIHSVPDRYVENRDGGIFRSLVGHFISNRCTMGPQSL